MRTLKLILEYDGTNYHGWQKQANALAVQNVLEDKLKILLKTPTSTTGAGRTDAGVHARMQVASFQTESASPCEKILKGLNGLIPKDIRVVSCEEAPRLFDARRDPLEKTYRYYWFNRAFESPFYRRTSWHVPQALDLNAMQTQLPPLVGLHDFTSFRALSCEAEHPRRKMLKASLEREGDLIVLSLTAEAFLHHMARIIAGTLTDFGLAKPMRSMREILEAKDRKVAGPTAPASGLILWDVKYGEIPRKDRAEKLKKRDGRGRTVSAPYDEGDASKGDKIA